MRHIDKLESRAREVLPSAVYDFYAGGAGDESTLEDNLSAWRLISLRPRMLRDTSGVDTGSALFDTPVSSPVCVAPTAFHRLAHPDAEVATASGAAVDGHLFTLSTRSTRTIEDVAGAAGSWWFQLYVMDDRRFTRSLVDRAVAAGASAVIVTVDTARVGRKRRDRDVELVPPEMLAANYGPAAWSAGTKQAPGVTAEELHALAERLDVPVVVKGILRGDDAEACVRAGARGIVVSNHGGRQLDGAIATARALPEVVDAVGTTAEIYVDGGIRNGSDMLRALAIGARAVFVGRPVLWALAVGGAGAVADLLRRLDDELRHAMALAGARTLAEVGRDLLAPVGAGGFTVEM